jgi:large subunit ribosomal protein L40
LTIFFPSVSNYEQILYGEPDDPLPSDEERLAAVSKVVPSLDAHETIELAWKIRQRKEREAYQSDMRDRYESMRAAIEELGRTDRRLYGIATKPDKFSTIKGIKGNAGVQESLEGRLEGLFPRQLRIPVDTPGKHVWDSEWVRPEPEEEDDKSPGKKGEEAKASEASV